MDWNWFFSSVAQSAAAIVAVFSAFIITKTINNQTQFDGNKRRIRALLTSSEHLKELAKYRRIGWYSQYLVNRETSRLQEKCRNGEAPKSAEEYYFNNDFSIFLRRADIIQRIESVMRITPICQPKNEISAILSKIKPVQDLAEEQMVMNEQNIIYDLIADIKKHIALLNDFTEELSENNESSPVIKWSILASLSLFLIGVIYPLGFLPLRLSTKIELSIQSVPDYMFSGKGVFLFIIATIFSGINLYFLHLNNNLTYTREEISKLKSHTVFGDYHVYFKNMEDNEKAKNEFFRKVEEAK